ncbi:hypothetical protein BJV74DRAFT_817791 [Russula compacta]|nr:hypothetical protein BJV74DRAFT_817791 [Russula compacta]
MHVSIISILAGAWMATAEVFVISVGSNGPTTFVPQRVDAVIGDVVVFNFTSGNHTATRTFSSPCIPAHETNITINGFDSGFRHTQPGTTGVFHRAPASPSGCAHKSAGGHSFTVGAVGAIPPFIASLFV